MRENRKKGEKKKRNHFSRVGQIPLALAHLHSLFPCAAKLHAPAQVVTHCPTLLLHCQAGPTLQTVLHASLISSPPCGTQ